MRPLPFVTVRWILIISGAIIGSGFPANALGGETNSPAKSTVGPGRPTAPKPEQTAIRSPSSIFRDLLHATPQERETWFAGRPATTRALVTAKLVEFQNLSLIEREIRLEVAELEYFLSPLLTASNEDRRHRLERIPAELRPLIELRLAEWDTLPRETRNELLEGKESLSYFIRSERVDAQQLSQNLRLKPTADRAELEAQFSRWAALSAEERVRKTALFQRFFDLSSAERQRTIWKLSEAERQQMQQALTQLGALDPQEREQCLAAIHQFSGLSPEEREKFMTNVARWKSMKPAEQAAWKALVDHLDLTGKTVPPVPPVLHPIGSVTTNR